MNTKLSLHRFLNFIGSELRSNRHIYFALLWQTIAIVIGLYAVLMLFGRSLPQAIISARLPLLFVIGLRSIMMASKSLNAYHKPLLAHQAILLPVSKVEKFVSIVLIYVVTIPVITFGLYVLIDSLATVIVSGQSMIIESLAYKSQLSVGAFVCDILLDGLMVYMVYLLGAIFFRRAQFLLTTISMLALFLIVGWLLIFYFSDKVTAHSIQFGYGLFFEIDMEQIGTIANLVLIPVITILAWLRYGRLQLKK